MGEIPVVQPANAVQNQNAAQPGDNWQPVNMDFDPDAVSPVPGLNAQEEEELTEYFPIQPGGEQGAISEDSGPMDLYEGYATPDEGEVGQVQQPAAPNPVPDHIHKSPRRSTRSRTSVRRFSPRFDSMGFQADAKTRGMLNSTVPNLAANSQCIMREAGERTGRPTAVSLTDIPTTLAEVKNRPYWSSWKQAIDTELKVNGSTRVRHTQSSYSTARTKGHTLQMGI